MPTPQTATAWHPGSHRRSQTDHHPDREDPPCRLPNFPVGEEALICDKSAGLCTDTGEDGDVFDQWLPARSEKLTSVWTPAGGYTIHARVARVDRHADSSSAEQEAPPVVLVPGLGMSGRYMVPLAEQLSDEFSVFAVDPPGFGRSTKPPRPLSVTELADGLADWMDALELGEAALIGNSLACHVIAELAVRHPSRVSRLILNSPAIDPHTRTAPQQLWRLFRTGFREPPSLLPIVLRDYLRAGPRRMWGTLRKALREPIEDTLPRVACPALVVRGTRDVLVSEQWAAEAARLLPCGRLTEMPGAPHAAHYAAAAEMADLIRPFLKKNDSRG